MSRQFSDLKDQKSDVGVLFNSGLALSLPPRSGEAAGECKARGSVHEREHLAQRWQIQYDELKFGESKAKGAYGEVFKGQYHKSIVAIKVYDFRGQLRQEQQDEVWREAALMESLRSEYLVGFRGLCFDPRYCLVMEYCDGGTLRARLDDKPAIALPQQLRWAMQISYGVYQLHRVRIIHRDLKTENILLDAQGHAKVADFGLSVMKSSSSSQSKRIDKNGVGTLPWMAPELFQGQSQVSSADVYSLGVVLWEIISRRLPFQGVMPAVIAGRVVLGHREIIEESWPPVFKTLIKACWDADPIKRPTAEQVGEECKAALDSLKASPTFIAESLADLALERLPEPAARRHSPSSALVVNSGSDHQSGERDSLLFGPPAEMKEDRPPLPRSKPCPASAWNIRRLALFLLVITGLLTGMFWSVPLLASLDVAPKPPAELPRDYRDYNDSIVTSNSSSALTDLFSPRSSSDVAPKPPAELPRDYRDYNDSIVTSNSSSALTDLFSPRSSSSRDDRSASALALQAQLVAACERGDLSEAKLAVLRGAELFNSDPEAKQPLAIAVRSMDVEMVDFLIFTQQLKGMPLMTWADCEKHNQQHYGQVFGITLPENFYRSTYSEWSQLLTQMEAFPVLSRVHLEMCQKVWNDDYIRTFSPQPSDTGDYADRRRWEWLRKYNLSQVSSWETLKKYVNSCAAYRPQRGEVVDTSLMQRCLEQTKYTFSRLQTSIQAKITEAVQAMEKAPTSFRP